MITGRQIRDGRALLRLGVPQLARLAQVGVPTLRDAEMAEGDPRLTIDQAAKIRTALETFGIALVPAHGGHIWVRTVEEVKLTGHQIRAARLLLGWGAWRLAREVRTTTRTLVQIEALPGAPETAPSTMSALKVVLEAAGIEFLNHGQPGVRMKVED